jgi:hypothetical protein
MEINTSLTRIMLEDGFKLFQWIKSVTMAISLNFQDYLPIFNQFPKEKDYTENTAKGKKHQGQGK